MALSHRLTAHLVSELGIDVKKSKLLKGSFEILHVLGKGSGGTTYLARVGKEAPSLCALKILDAKQATREVVDAFLNECKMLQGLNHPHLARLLSYGQEQDTLYYSSEFVEGRSLVEAGRALDWNALFQLIVQGAWALDYLQDQGVIHGDLKPENILVGRVHPPGAPPGQDRLVLKIIDFGLASLKKERGRSKTKGGTLPYMAPEILSGKAVDHKADLYSWGVLLYQMALGRLPHERGDSFSRYLTRILKEEIDLGPLKAGDTPEGVIELIRRLVVKNPRDRMANALDIIKLLNQIEGENFPLKAQELYPIDTKRLETHAPSFIPPEKLKALPPEHILQELLKGVRSGRRPQTWERALEVAPIFRKSKNLREVEKFYELSLFLLIEMGRLQEARRWLQELKEHPLIQGHGSLEPKLLKLQILLREGKLTRAKEVLSSTKDTEIQKGSLEQQARWFNFAGTLAKGRKHLGEAARHFERAAKLSEESGRKDHQLALLINAAGLYHDEGAWTKAYTLAKQVLPQARKLGHPGLLATLLNNLGNLYLYFGRWNEAHQHLSESLQIAQGQGQKGLVAYNYYLLTVAEEGRGNWERVEEFLERAFSKSQELGKSQPILQAILARGYFFLNQKKEARCQKTINDLRIRAAKAGQEFYQRQADWLEAKLRIQVGKVKGAPVARWLEAIRREALSRGHRSNLWQVTADQGNYALALGKKEEAKKAFQEALGLIDELAKEVPEIFRKSFYRDRKKEGVRSALEKLTKGKPKEKSRGEQRKGTGFEQWAELNQRILMQKDLNPLLEEILDAAIELTDAERGFVIYSDTQEMEIRAARNLDKESLRTAEERFSYTIAQEVLTHGEPEVIFDAQHDERFSEAASVHALKLRSVLCVPLHSGVQTVGLIYLDNRIRQGIFRKEHLPLLKALADQASLALEHARLHLENRTKIEELRASQAQLEESKALVEKLNARLQQDLIETTTDLKALREGLRREHEEMSLRYRYEKIVGKSPALRSVLKTLDRIVDSDINVYIFGESGTGKELIARAIHFNGPRKKGPFISENCAALSEQVLESEIFGHVRGAFTGADKDKVGLFEMAHQGTLFLDEVGDMSPALQSKLLRALQEGEIRPVGGERYRKVNVRVLSASNKDLKKLSTEGEFRLDLFFRLSVARLDLPPLRERSEDIPLLVEQFLAEEAEKQKFRPPKISKRALKVLMNYPWPGNIRELQNEIQRILVLRPKEISVGGLSPHIRQAVQERQPLPLEGGLGELTTDLERKAILLAMERYRGNKVQVAKGLKITRRTLYAKLRQFGIAPEFGKGPSKNSPR